LRHVGETTGFPERSVGGDEPSVAQEPLRAAENEEWAWMVDEDPAFYLKKPGGAETGGA
jgi:hypothetical protein